MAKIEKLLERLLSYPTDFTWEELVKILKHFGYEEKSAGKTGGSRRRFLDARNNVIRIHKLHPGNIIKLYMLKEIIAHLKEKNKIL